MKLNTIVATPEVALADIKRGYYEQVWSRQERKTRVCVLCHRHIGAGELFYRWAKMGGVYIAVKHFWEMCSECFNKIEKS